MNLLLLFAEDFVSPCRARFNDERADHVRTVLKADPGRRLRAGVVGRGLGEAIVTEVGKERVEVEIGPLAPPPEARPVFLILALPRPQTLKKVLEVVGSFGVARLDLVDAGRVQKSYFSSKLLKNDAWHRHVRLGMEQGGQIRMPEINVHRAWRRFLDDPVDSVCRAAGPRLVADPEAGQTLWDSPLADLREPLPIVAALGPEGGWLPEEISGFKERGFQPVSLATPVLRVENALTALLAEVRFLERRKGSE